MFDKRKLIILLIPILFTSCDCHFHVSGTVIDSQTDKPMEGVIISKSKK